MTRSDSQNERQPTSDPAPVPLEPLDLDGPPPGLATAMRLTALPSLLVVYAPWPNAMRPRAERHLVAPYWEQKENF